MNGEKARLGSYKRVWELYDRGGKALKVILNAWLRDRYPPATTCEGGALERLVVDLERLADASGLRACGEGDNQRYLPNGAEMVAKFRKAWRRLDAKGLCGEPGGVEYRRVLDAWIAAGFPRRVTRFIRRASNRPAEGGSHA